MSELPQPPEHPPAVSVSRPAPSRDWIPHPSTARRPGSAGPGCGFAAVLGVLALVGIVGIALAAVAFRGGDAPVERSVSDLEVGDCLVQPGGGTEYMFEVTDCDDPHDDEVFATGRLNRDGATPYPDLGMLRAHIERICAGQVFQDYVGVPAAETTYRILFITPDQQAWREAGGAYVCLIDSAGTSLKGSARGTAR